MRSYGAAMELRIFTEPQQGATYGQLLAVARRAEERGFGAFFRSDHYLSMGGVSGLPGPSDAWTTLAGLARDTTTIRLGTLVTASTFRHPGPLAIAVANIDDMSGGRVELGIGAAWYEAEHAAYGIPFPSTRERFDRLTEQLQIIEGLWTTPVGATFDFDGVHYRLQDSPALPKPFQQPRPPVIIGGSGPRRTPDLVARFADEFNVAWGDTATVRSLNANVDSACRAVGRDPSTVIRSAAQVLCVGVDEGEIARRAAVIGREVDELRANGLAGTPEELVAKVQTYADVGISRIYLQVLDLDDLAHIDLVADSVMPAVADR